MFKQTNNKNAELDFLKNILGTAKIANIDAIKSFSPEDINNVVIVLSCCMNSQMLIDQDLFNLIVKHKENLKDQNIIKVIGVLAEKNKLTIEKFTTLISQPQISKEICRGKISAETFDTIKNKFNNSFDETLKRSYLKYKEQEKNKMTQMEINSEVENSLRKTI